MGGNGVKGGDFSDPCGIESKLPSATCASGSEFGNGTSLNPPAPATSGWIGGDIAISRLLLLTDGSVPKKGAPLMLLVSDGDGAGGAVFSVEGIGGVGVRADVGKALSIVDDRPDNRLFSRTFALEPMPLIVPLLVNVGVVAARGRDFSMITVSSMPVGAVTFFREDSCWCRYFASPSRLKKGGGR